MIIDAHVHLFGPDFNASAQMLLASMDQAGIDKAALFAFPRRALTNEEAIIMVERFPDRFFAIGGIHPLSVSQPPPHYLETRLSSWLKARKLHGLKFYTGYDHFYANDIDLLAPYMRLLEAVGLPAIFHTGNTFTGVEGTRIKFTEPLPIDDLACEFPSVPIIIAHLANPWFETAAEVICRNPNVYADISGWIEGDLSTPNNADYKELLRRKLMDTRAYLGGLHKLLFGSDWPISAQASYAEFTRELSITDEEKQLIFFENAKRLFGV